MKGHSLPETSSPATNGELKAQRTHAVPTHQRWLVAEVPRRQLEAPPIPHRPIAAAVGRTGRISSSASRFVSLRTATMVGLALRVVVLAVIAVAMVAGKEGKTVKKQLRAEPEPDAPEVQLSVGWMSGRWMRTRAGRTVAAFTKIPYAQPPVEELRFKPPVPLDSWSEPRESPPLEQVPVCMQPEQNYLSAGPKSSEDCLYLNVFTPSPVNGSNLPVLVWLHPGGFREGGAALYGPEYLLDRDLVLVTLNYRLGALGFLSTGDGASTGNWGLKDQQLALRWVQQHIAALGGDPDRVTLAGQSAGGVSAHTHTAARTSAGLFQRVVSLGGSALSAGLPHSAEQARRLAAKLAVSLGCPAEPSAELVSCLRAKPAHALLAHEASLREGGLCPLFTWAPVVEDFLEEDDKVLQEDPPFLEQHPIDALTSGLAHDVPWLAGMNLNEGGLWAASIQASNQIEAFDSNLDRLAPLCFGFNDTAHPDDLPGIMEELREFYFGANNITRENLGDLSNMITDGIMLSSLDEAMRLHAAYSAAPGFMYLFSHRGQRSFTDVVDGGASGRGSQGDLGVVHGDELLSLFPLALLVPAPRGLDNAEDRKVSETLLDFLVNFAKTGNPTLPSSENAQQSVPWKPVESEDLEFLEVAQGGRLLKGAGLLGNRAHFWSALPLSARNIRNMQSSIPQPRKRDEF